MRLPRSVIGRVRPTAVQSAQVSANNAQAQIGQNLQGGFDALQRAAAEAEAGMRERQNATEQFTAMRDFSTFQGQVNEELDNISRTAKPDGSDYLDRADEAFNKLQENYLRSVPAHHRDQFTVQSNAFRVKTKMAAIATQHALQDAALENGFQQELIRSTNRVGQDRHTLDEETERLTDMVANPNWKPERRAELMADIRNRLQTAAYRKRSEEVAHHPTSAPTAVVSSIIDAAAARHGVSAKHLKRLAMIESGGDVNIRNKAGVSSAGGLFQIIDGTAKQYGVTNRFDPIQASDAAARIAKDASKYLTANGFKVTDQRLWIAHNQGAGGAVALLKAATFDPNIKAVDVVGRAQVLNNGGTADMTAQEFINTLSNYYDGEKREFATSASQIDIDSEPEFEAVTLEDRITIQKSARSNHAAKEAARRKAQTDEEEALTNKLLFEIRAGRADAATLQQFIDSGQIRDFKNVNKLEVAIEKYNGDKLDIQRAVEMAQDKSITFSGTEGNKAGNLLYNEYWKTPLNEQDQNAVTQSVVPFVREKTFIPPQLADHLVTDMQSNDMGTALFAFQTAEQLMQASNGAFTGAFTQAQQAQIVLFSTMKTSNLSSPGELLKLVQGDKDLLVREATEINDKLATSLLQNREFMKNHTLEEIENRIEPSGRVQNRDPDSFIKREVRDILMVDWQRLFRDGLRKTGDPDNAAKYADTMITNIWGVHDSVLMRLPPEKMGYPKMYGGMGWITEQARTELDLLPGQRLQIFGDGVTEDDHIRHTLWSQNEQKRLEALEESQEFDRPQGDVAPARQAPRRPTYQAWIVQDGVARQLRQRVSFNPDAPDVQERHKRWEAQGRIQAQIGNDFEEILDVIDWSKRTGRPLPPEYKNRLEALETISRGNADVEETLRNIRRDRETQQELEFNASP